MLPRKFKINEKGIKFQGESTDNSQVLPTPSQIPHLLSIDSQSISKFISQTSDIEFIIASDVTNPLLGSLGATSIFGPQKIGNSENLSLEKHDILEVLEKNMEHMNNLWKKWSGFTRDCSKIEGSGAAGGISLPLLYTMDNKNIKICSGFELVADYCGLDEALEGADLVITGKVLCPYALLFYNMLSRLFSTNRGRSN